MKITLTRDKHGDVEIEFDREVEQMPHDDRLDFLLEAIARLQSRVVDLEPNMTSERSWAGS